MPLGGGLADWEFEYQGLRFGGNQDFRLNRVTGLHPPDSREEVIDRAEDHGAHTFAKFLQPRYIEFEGDVSDNGDMEALITTWREAFQPRDSDAPLSFLIPGDGDITKRVHAVPVRRFFPVDPFYSVGYTEWRVAMLCGDPRIYSEALNELIISPGTPPGGIDFSVDFDLNFGGGSSVAGAAVNDGFFPTRPTARIDGPCTNPKVQNDNTPDGAQFVQLNLTLASGDYIDIDFAEQTILLNGTASRYNALSEDSDWWELGKGSSTIQFIVSGATGATKLTLNWRDAWI